MTCVACGRNERTHSEGCSLLACPHRCALTARPPGAGRDDLIARDGYERTTTGCYLLRRQPADA